MTFLRLLVVTAIATSLVSLGCDKLPGLGRKDAEAEGGAGAGGAGGALSFLSAPFEGEITMNMSGKAAKAPMTLVFALKSPRVRVDMSGAGVVQNPVLAQGASCIIDPPAKKGYLLMAAQKKAMVIDFDKAKAQRLALPGVPGAGAPGTPVLTEPPKVEKTGQKEVVAGYTCELWKVSGKNAHADMCVAEGIRWIDLTDLGLASPEVTLLAAASDLNHFPLRVVAYDDRNVETTRMEATKIEKKKLDDARFLVPADYQQIDMAAMFGNLQGLGAPGAHPGARPAKR